MVGSFRTSTSPSAEGFERIALVRARRSPFATLRLKTVSIIAVTLVGLLIIVFIPMQIFLRGSFVELEQQIMRRNAERAASALADGRWALRWPA